MGHRKEHKKYFGLYFTLVLFVFLFVICVFWEMGKGPTEIEPDKQTFFGNIGITATVDIKVL